MQLIIFLPILLSIALFACLAKLAARVMQGARVKWSTCLLFALLLTGLTGLRLAFMPNATAAWHPAVSLAVGVGLVIAAGGWFFKGRARTAADLPFGFSRAAAMTAL